MILNTVRYLIPLAGLLLALGAEAQQLNNPCPGGGVPSGGRCVSPAEANANRGGGSSRPVYTEIWENRFGAIASDPNSAEVGVSENEVSKRQAEKVAKERCGSSSCRITISVRNSCQAAAWGGGHAGYGGADTKEDATTIALNNCSSKGHTCEVKYVGCSLPVRVK